MSEWPIDEPTPWGTTPAQLRARRELLRIAAQHVERTRTACTHCMQFSMGRCEQHGQIPDEFQRIENECQDWKYDGIPF